MKIYDYALKKFPEGWVKNLQQELHKEFGIYPVYFSCQGRDNYLPPVVKSSILGKIAGKFPSKPQGITIWGTIYYTPSYPVVMQDFIDNCGEEEGLVYEFGMYSHETYHAIEQELTGKTRWFIKYIFNLIKTPNAHKHPMEIPAYAFQQYLKRIARGSIHLDTDSK